MEALIYEGDKEKGNAEWNIFFSLCCNAPVEYMKDDREFFCPKCSKLGVKIYLNPSKH